MRTPTILFIASVSIACLAACGERREAASKPAVAGQTKVLATVNGVPITEVDLDQRAKRSPTGGGPSHDQPGNVLQTLVRDELISQKSIQLGLDRDEEYRQKLDDLEAQLRAFKRQELSALYRRYVQQQSAVTDSEAQAYFEKNAASIRTRFHVLQIFYKGRYPEILRDHQDLKGGMSFEEVAARRFPALPANIRRPWDLGELRWYQLPQSWRGVVDRLEPGQISDVLQGENERSWVIKLVSKAVDPGVSFATEKERIVAALHQQKADALYESMLAEMKDKAKIAYSK